MRLRIILFFVLLFFVTQIIVAQTKATKEAILKATNVERLLETSKSLKAEREANRARALEMADEKGWIIRKETDKMIMELQGVTEDGRPMYYVTHNADAAESISTDDVNPGGAAGLNLDGTGMIVGEWDGGDVRATHQEFNNTGSSRVIDKDGNGTLSSHATHVAGTIVAGGVVSSAKGMAPNATLHAYDWTNDESEMAAAAADGLLMSNHSYGFAAGWSWNGSSWEWVGNTSISTEEDYRFGFYGFYCVEIDEIALDAPYYLIVKSAGNDRGDGEGEPGHPMDGGADGFDCISYKGNAKNILTVGATMDVNGGYTGDPNDVQMSSFSSWGPADDGRIKPDISANGVTLYSSEEASDNDYGSKSGTSMSSPSVTGSMTLLQQHYQELYGAVMKAATLKALVIHTADEAGPNDGPDYMFGWGLMNTRTAAEVISGKGQSTYINEEILSDGGTYTLEVTASGNAPLVATIVWADPAGTPAPAQLDPTDIMLVNDLDMNITDGSTTYFPWMLDGQNPANAATTGDNNVDNVEKVFIANPTAGSYTITIDHDGSITDGPQAFSLIVSGVEAGQFTSPTNLEASVTGTTVDLIWTKPIEVTPSSDLLDDGFESYTDFSLDFAPWTQVDNDGGETWGSDSFDFTNEGYTGSFIVFNPNSTNPPNPTGWDAHSGNKYAACFNAVTASAPNDDWLISPQLTIDGSYTLSFWAKSITDQYGLERMKVGISTTGNSTGDFSIVSTGSYEEVPTAWTQYTYDLSGYDGEDIYFAINCVSNDAFALFIDDVLVTDAKGNIVYGNSFEDDDIKVVAQRDKVEWNRDENTVFKSLTGPASTKATLSGYKIYRTGVSDAVYTINSLEDTTYTDSNLEPGNYSYYVKATYTAPNGESAASNTENITIEFPPVASAQVTLSCSEDDGDVKVLSNRSGTQTFYLMDDDGNELDSWTGNATSYTFTSLNNGLYRGQVEKDGAMSNLSGSVTVYTLPATEITSQPQDANVNEGESVNFIVIADGEDKDYEWRKDGVLLSNGGNISGATSSVLSISDISSGDEGTYEVTVIGQCGTVVSDGAVLSIGTGLMDTYGNQINIYPNPTKGELNISFDDRMAEKYNVYDLTGRLIQSGLIESKNHKVVLFNENKGIYMIELLFSDQAIRTKIILE